MFLVADASQREELAKQFLSRLPLTEDHAEWRVVLNAIELLIQQGNQEVNNRNSRHSEIRDFVKVHPKVINTRGYTF